MILKIKKFYQLKFEKIYQKVRISTKLLETQLYEDLKYSTTNKLSHNIKYY